MEIEFDYNIPSRIKFGTEVPMWYGLRVSSDTNPNLISSATDLLQSTSRILIGVTGFLSLLWYIWGTATLSTFVPPLNILLIFTIVEATAVLSLRLLPKRHLLAQAVWLVGLTTGVTLVIYMLQIPEISFIFILFPFMAIVTVGWPAGVLMEGVIIALILWITQNPVMPEHPASYSLAIAIGGIVVGIVGWVSTYTHLSMTQWALTNFELAGQRLKDAQDQQLELRQIQDDLSQANSEYARLSERYKILHYVAEEARRAKEEFVANVSHELRTPLNMIIGFSEMIPQLSEVYGMQLPQPLLADITAIRRNSQHLSNLVDDVLNLSQAEAGRVVLNKKWTSLHEIAKTANLSVSALFKSKGLYLESDIPSDLPDVFCDDTRIRQVLLNLLSNAGRFTEHGGARVKAFNKNGQIIVSVTDTGPGIPEEDQERIFEPFQQLDDSVQASYGGSGLGLNISKKFIEMHNGKMWLESELGKGTSVYFSLPIEMPYHTILDYADDARRWFNPHVPFEPRLRKSKATAPEILPRFILLDDDETLREMFTRFGEEVEITCFSDPKEAILELDRFLAHALVVNAPPSDHAQILEIISESLHSDIPVFMCWIPGEKELLNQQKIADYLIKPIISENLLSALKGLGDTIEDILIVDDNPELMQLFTRMLSSAEPEFRVLQARGGKRALDLLRERQPDAMLLDLVMPDMNGYQVLDEKNQDPSIKDIPVIVVSSQDPRGGYVSSKELNLVQRDGLSMRDIVTCVQSISEILLPEAQPDDQGLQEDPVL